MSKRAVEYIRVSSVRQSAEDRVSIEAQIADCDAYCRERGYVVVARYVDKDKYRVRKKLVQPSGQRKDRPAYQAMLKAARAGEFDVIVAWKEDRLYRGMYAAMPFSELLDEMGKRLDVELVKEMFDRRMLGIKAALGKLEVDGIRERMVMGRRVRLERGEVPGGEVRYGYRKVDRRLEINEAEAAVVRQMFGWYTSGENNMQIRRRLNGMGIPPRKNKLWSKTTIQTILSTTCYTTGQYVTTLDGEEFTIYCPPIISAEIWQRSLEVREGNKKLPRNIKEDFLVAGLVYCACGWKIKAIARRPNENRGYHSIFGVYTCPRIAHEPENLPPDCAPQTGSRFVDEYVWEFIRGVCRNRELTRGAIALKLASLEAEHGDVEAEADRVQRQLDDMTMERQWVITQARKGSITAADMELQLGALQFQAMGLQKELQERQTVMAFRQKAEALSAWASEYLSGISDGIEVLSTPIDDMPDEQRQTVAAKLNAGQYADKFPGDEMAQLKWAILEEKRRVVRTMISRVIIAKVPGGVGRGMRKVIPVLSLPFPLDSLGYDDQSPDYKVAGLDYPLRLTLTPEEISRDDS